jgi:hypothetical protein
LAPRHALHDRRREEIGLDASNGDSPSLASGTNCNAKLLVWLNVRFT